MKGIKVLDVTLRDGGCVNNFNFGSNYMHKILFAQESAGIDIIELGYLDEKKGTKKERTQYSDEQAVISGILEKKVSNIKYVAMMDYGKYSVKDLHGRTQDGVDGIRLAFHKEQIPEAIQAGRVILDKGYELYIQPMVSLRYSDMEFLKLIELVNQELADAAAFYIVDSFGEMRANDVIRILELIDHNLVPSMPIGFHSHNNLQLSYANAMTMLKYETNRSLLLDSSIMGMGKGAGNLNTELLLEHLNLYYGKKYQVTPLLEVIDRVIKKLQEEYHWGYSPEYYLSSLYHCSPSYADYYYNKHMMTIERIGELLAQINPSKRFSFDEKYADELYRTYNGQKVIDDKEVVKELVNNLSGRKILLLAPGKTVTEAKKRITQIKEQERAIVIGVNMPLQVEVDYALITRKDLYDEAIEFNKTIITTSNIADDERENVRVLNYEDWIEFTEKTQDSSLVIALNLLKKCSVEEIYMVGFDGYISDMKNNYCDEYFTYTLSKDKAKEINEFNRVFIAKMAGDGLRIRFVTPSLYQVDKEVIHEKL